MTMQMRPKSGGVAYAPARDLTLLFPHLAQDVAKRMEEKWFAPLHDLLEKEGITDEDMAEACGAHCRYLVLAHEDPEENFEDVLRRSGWLDVKPLAQVAYMFYLGQCVSGSFFPGIRDMLQMGDESFVTIHQLKHYAQRMRILMRMPRWKRWVVLHCKWLRSWMRKRYIPDHELKQCPTSRRSQLGKHAVRSTPKCCGDDNSQNTSETSSPTTTCASTAKHPDSTTTT